MRREVTSKEKKLRHPKLSKLARKEELEFYLFISPWIIGFVFFTGGPIIASFLISLTNWSILSAPQWTGLTNYTKLFTDPIFYRVLLNTAYYSCGSVSLGVGGSLIAGLLLNQRLPGLRAFRTIYYLPTVIAGIPMVLLFLWLYNPSYGLFNYVLSRLGVGKIGWLWDENWAMPSLILMNLWRIGGNMIIFLAALHGVPQSLYDAARADGANFWHQFIYITLPMISPIIFLVVVISTIASFQVFLEPYVLTEGGPANATLTYVLYLYRNGFQWWKVGYASTMAWILLIILLSLTGIQFKLARYWVHYGGR
ncbi:Lactose transport system permease protein LacF [subsurface metagenome]